MSRFDYKARGAEEVLPTIALATVVPVPDVAGHYRVSFKLGDGVRIECDVFATGKQEAEKKVRLNLREKWPQWRGMI